MRSCLMCPKPLPENARPSAKYCGATCRKRAQRGGKAAPALVVAPEPVRVSGRVAASVAAQLADAGLLETPAGLTALALAERLDAAVDTGSAMAAVSREMHALLDRTLSTVDAKANPFDELQALRERRRA